MPLRLKCAECDCVVESGRRVFVCGRPECCCGDVPSVPGAVNAPRRIR